MTNNMLPPIPILRSFDESRALAFYVDWLGFRVDWRHRFAENLPLYFQVSRSGCILHLSEHHGDACPGAALRIPVADVDALHAELQGRPYSNYSPQVKDMPWGSRDMQVIDPFGNRLVFTTDSFET